MKIYKFPLEIVDEQQIRMIPKGCKYLSVQNQHGTICLWVLGDFEGRTYVGSTTIRIVGTGNPFPDANECHYIGTVQDGGLVWHVFHKDHS